MKQRGIKMNEELILNYILKQIEWDKTKLKSMNLGFNLSKQSLMEIELLEESEKYIEKIIKKKKFKIY